MICTQCRTENRDKAKFCKGCGTKVSASAEKAQETISTGGQLLDNLVGLDEVKGELVALKDILDGMRRNGLPARMPFNTILVGGSGTAKTFVGNALAAILHTYGAVEKGVPKVVEGDALEGMTPDDLSNLFSGAKGGVLFVDNAHKLIDREGKASATMGRFINLVDAHRNDPVVVLAGLPFGFREFVKHPENKGVTGRFQKIFFIPDYLPVQYAQIVEHDLSRQGFQLDDAVRGKLLARFRLLYKSLKSPDSEVTATNGYLAQQETQSILGSYFRRKATDRILLPQDVTEPVETKKPLSEVMAELDSIIGMENVKKEIRELHAQLQAGAAATAAGGAAAKPLQHMVVTGNPGTGKTTVARILGRILEGLGLLESGHVVEVDRSKMVASYVGQTAPQVNALCDQAMGGILFIDEAYSLASGGGGSGADFGKEAIDALLKRMEDDRGKFVVLAAGYKGPIDNFLAANEGLRSRFELFFHLDDYQPGELSAIFGSLAAKQKYRLGEGTAEKVEAFFKDRCARKTKDFANGREARNLLTRALRLQ